MKKCALAMMLFGMFAFVNVAQAEEEAGEDPLAALAELGDSLAMESVEAGGSIRAKKDADLSAAKRKKDKKNLMAKVTGLKKQAFPWVALKLKVIRPPRMGPYTKKVKRNQEIVVIPEYKATKNGADLTDEKTLLNAGAYYLRSGDKIVVQLKEKRGKAWIASYLERK